jgi:hypothetical protein
MSLRVLYAPRSISGQASEYVSAVRPHGVDGEVWSYGEPAYGFDADRVIDTERLLTDPRQRWELLDEAVRSFDVFHLQYSRSLLSPEGHVLPELWDIPLLKSLGKRVIMHFRGSDIRRPSMHTAREPDSYMTGATVDEDRIAGRIAVCRRFCDAMLVSTPGLLDEVPDALWLPHVLDVAAWRTARGAEPDVPIVSHIPSSRGTKGSDVIDPALRALDAEGVISYRSLSGLGRAELRTAIQQTDVLVDSLTIGDNGLISVEAMAAGAIAVAHLHDDNRARNVGTPVVEATIHDVADTIRALAGDPARRAALREASTTFAAHRHDREVAGRTLVELYRRPATTVDRSHPDWPRSETRRRVQELEAEVDRLRSDIDPLVQGRGPLRAAVPGHALDRMLTRVATLESALAAHAPDHPLLTPAGRRSTSDTAPTWRTAIKRNPTVHRVARKTALTLRRRLGR